MFSWIEKKKYNSEVSDLIAAMLLMSEGDSIAALKKGNPYLDEVIDDGFQKKQNKFHLAVTLASRILGRAIESGADSKQKAKVLAAFLDWSKRPDDVANALAIGHQGKIPKRVDPVLWRSQWAFAFVSDLKEQKHIADFQLEYCLGEITGALSGKSSEIRDRERLELVGIARADT